MPGFQNLVLLQNWDYRIIKSIIKKLHNLSFLMFFFCFVFLFVFCFCFVFLFCFCFVFVEKVYFKSQILVHEYWTILDHFWVLVLCTSGCHQHVLKNVNITFSGNTGTPELFQYSPILGRSSIWDLKYTFSVFVFVFVFVFLFVFCLFVCLFVFFCVFRSNGLLVLKLWSIKVREFQKIECISL